MLYKDLAVLDRNGFFFFQLNEHVSSESQPYEVNSKK